MRMPRRALMLVATVAMCLASAPAAAGPDVAERRLVALRLLEATIDDAEILRLSAGPVQQLLRATHALQPDLSQHRMMVLSALYHDEMHSAAIAALRGRAGDLAARYSLGELRALQGFSQTPEGRSVLAEDGMPAGDLELLIEREMLARMDAALDRHGRGD